MMLSITFQLEWMVYYFLQLSGANVRAKVGGGGLGDEGSASPIL